MNAIETAQLNKSVVRRLMTEVWCLGKFELIPELISDDYVGHLSIGDHYGPEGVRIEIASFRSAIPDLEITLDDLLADGNRVVRRFTLRGTHCRPYLGIPASGSGVLVRGIAIDRLEEGRLAESWVQTELVPP